MLPTATPRRFHRRRGDDGFDLACDARDIAAAIGKVDDAGNLHRRTGKRATGRGDMRGIDAHRRGQDRACTRAQAQRLDACRWCRHRSGW
jgi:hypothetical protein